MPDSDDGRPLVEEQPAKRDFRQEVTDNLISMLEKGTAPWQKPWEAQKGMAIPFNPTTDKSYRGGNAVHLLATGAARGFEDPRWMTYRQAQENGWQVRKGEKGTRIEFWQFRDRERDGDTPSDAGGDAKNTAPLHRIYTVFNGAQIDGIPSYEPQARPEWEVVQSAERIIAGSGVRILHDQPDRAYYSQREDRVHLPPERAFPTPARYYGTVLHELVHATGHPARLNRDTLTKSEGFGSETYAKEELRAELGSLFLAAERGIPHDPEQHAAYVGAWIKALRDDKNEIFRASKDASRATEYLLEREQELEQGQEQTPEIIARETSEHVAEFDPNNGAVTIVEKNTATTARDLVEPAIVAAQSESAAISREQILDNVVDGRAAPIGLSPNPAARTAESLNQAKALVERELGAGARTMTALTDSGRYDGPILGVTDEHVVQGYTSKVGIIHERANLIEDATVDREQPVLIEYNRGHAHIQALALTHDDRGQELDLALERGAVMTIRERFTWLRHRLADWIGVFGLPRDFGNLVPPDVYQQPTSLYKMPEKPGFLGGYNGRSAAIGILGLFMANVLATQIVAWMFSYQRALGVPWFRFGKSFALYAPWNWIIWVFRHSAAEDARTRFAVLLGPFALCVALVVCFGMVYYLNLRRTRKLSQNTDEIHGSARWAQPADMEEAGVLGQTEGVYIGGWYDRDNQRLHYLRHDGPEHVLVFAPTRSGKGVSLVIPTLLAWNESAVIYDIKGENWAKTAGRRAEAKHLCLQFAPCDESGRTTRFNPLAEIRVGTLRDVSDAQNIADILVKNLDNKPNDTHWIDTASIIVMGSLLHICYEALGEGREANLADLASHFAIYGQNFRDTLKIMAATEHDKHGKFGWTLPDGRPSRVHPTVLECVQKMLDKADREFSSVVSTINTALAIYADPLVRRNTAASDFTVNDLVNFERPVSLYIVVPPSDRLRLSPLLRLVFTLIVNRLTYRMAFTPGGAAAEASGTEPVEAPLEQVRNRYRLLMMIDEFPTLKKMELFADALSYMGGYGIKAYLIAQDLQQIYDSYGVHESIVSNCHVRVAFAPNKIETARLLSEMTGKITVEKASFSFSGSRVSPVLDHITSSVQQIERALMTADEVMRLRPPRKTGSGRDERITHPGEMLIFISGTRPVLGTQMLYFKDPVMLKFSRIAPPLHLKAIEDGQEVQQRPLHLARHIVSRQEKDRPSERATPAAVATSLQPAPPSHDFHVMHLASQDPRYVPPVPPPARPAKPTSASASADLEALVEKDAEAELEPQ